MVFCNYLTPDVAQVETKLPGKTVLWLFVSICILIFLVLGFGIGYGSGRNVDSGSRPPFYYFISNTSESCPALSGGRLLTTVGEGQSFEVRPSLSSPLM